MVEIRVINPYNLAISIYVIFDTLFRLLQTQVTLRIISQGLIQDSHCLVFHSARLVRMNVVFCTIQSIDNFSPFRIGEYHITDQSRRRKDNCIRLKTLLFLVFPFQYPQCDFTNIAIFRTNISDSVATKCKNTIIYFIILSVIYFLIIIWRIYSY